MNERILLGLFQKYTERRFIEVKESVVTHFDTGEIIPVELLYLGKIPKDGLYLCSDRTCDGGSGGKQAPPDSFKKCAVGKPSKKCVSNGLYSPNNCATYNPTIPVAELDMPFNVVLKILGEINDSK